MKKISRCRLFFCHSKMIDPSFDSILPILQPEPWQPEPPSHWRTAASSWALAIGSGRILEPQACQLHFHAPTQRSHEVVLDSAASLCYQSNGSTPFLREPSDEAGLLLADVKYMKVLMATPPARMACNGHAIAYPMKRLPGRVCHIPAHCWWTH